MKNDKTRKGGKNLIDLCTLDEPRRQPSEWQSRCTALQVKGEHQRISGRDSEHDEKELFFIRVIKFAYS